MWLKHSCQQKRFYLKSTSTYLLREARANMKNIVVLLNVMVVILADTVAVEQGF